MEALYVSGVVGLLGLIAIVALRLRPRPQQAALIEVRGETAVGAHRMVLVEVEGHKLLVSHTQSGLALLAAFAAPSVPPASIATSFAERSDPNPTQESRPLQVQVAAQLPSSVPVSLLEPMQGAPLSVIDFSFSQKGECTQQFPFEIQQLAARRG